MTQRVLVTGGLGFVGKALAAGLSANGFTVRVSSRKKLTMLGSCLECSQVSDLSASTDWRAALHGVDIVVHCAGRAHVMKETTSDPLVVFREVNVQGTLNLARQSFAAGVKRFIFLSSIGVNGARTEAGKAFSETDQPHPHNAYALSKWEAEQGLRHIADETGLEIVIIRPPLVYGLGAPGNFGSLMRAVRRGWFLPLGAVRNQRSLVAIDNLVDFIKTCIVHPQAANQIFLLSDGHDLSTTELVRGLAYAAGLSQRLVPVPVWVLRAGAALLGRGDAVDRLCGNLQVDIFKARDLLDWVPPVSVYDGLRCAVQGNFNEKNI